MFETWIETDTTKLPTVMKLMGRAFRQDDEANKVGVIVKENGVAKNFAGNVDIKGFIIKPDGSMIKNITGNKSDNKAWIILPAAAYAQQGVITVTIKAVNGTEVSTLGAVEAYVYPSL